jgi:serine/threonine-protein kinase
VNAPRVLGRYALYGEIAAGGMATVHYGRLLGPVGFSRTVAIKRLHAHLAKDPEFVSMFLDEARLAARIRHPNVVPTLDVVALDGELFLVMDYIQGESLARLLRATRAAKQRLRAPVAGTIVAAALHGLHAAHEATSEHGEPLAIVHRDVSPQNILVGIDGNTRVLDFGVAKAAGRLHTTREGQLKGKLAYMSPEQLQGTVTRSTDVYACGVVLWEALAGRRLFSGENEGEILTKVQAGPTAPPSRFAPDLPSAVDDIVMRALAREPDARFATARDMARALERELPLLPASDVGEWVEAIAGRGLAERAARVAEIESSSSLDTAPVPAPPAADDDATTQLSSGSATNPDRAAPRVRRWTIAIACSAAIGLAGLAFGLRGGFARRAPAPAAAASATTVTASPAPSGDTAPPPSASASASASAPTVASAPSAARAARPAASARPSPAARPPPSAAPAPGKGLGGVLDTRR